jgi:putative ABC transport system permease protein
MRPARTARRAVARWAWRMFRREWRQQVLVLSLLTVAVAAAIGLASAAYTTTPVPDNAEFGAANHLVKFTGSDPQVLEADVAAARDWFDTYEVIYHRAVPVPGLFEPVDYRSQDPNGPLGGPRLALVEGTFPTGSQVAVTDEIAAILDLSLGVGMLVDGSARTVVGIVENPGDLADEFVLVAPSQQSDADAVTILVDATDDQANTFRIPSGGDLEIGSRLVNEDLIAALGVLALETVALLLIGLIAAASFIVIAHRRMRQLGMLAAVGATEKQLRLVTIGNGAIIGFLAAGLGAGIGVLAWLAVAPRVEGAVGYRIDELDVPAWLIAGGMFLAVVAGSAAAWWPARKVARVPAVRALSGRPPEPKPARGAAALAGVFAVVGVACLAAGGDLAADDDATWTHAALIVAGTVAILLAVLFACPPALRLLAACVGRLPIAVRLAIGDLARYQTRSAAALAAISLALAIAVTITVASAAAQSGADEGNLAENQLLIRAAHVDGPFIPQDGELDELQAGVDRVVSSFDNTEVTLLEAAIHPASGPDPSFDGRVAMALAKRSADGWMDVSLLYVATPELLDAQGYALEAVAPGTDVITRETGELGILGDPRPDSSKVEARPDVERLEPGYTSLPGTFVSPAMLDDRGWVAAPSGRWLVETAEPPTPEQLGVASDVAAAAGLTVEVRDRQTSLGGLRVVATLVGVLVSLAIVAMTVGLVRSEAGRDLRILTATGATRRARRTLTAATAGGLAILGAGLGTAGAYLGLTAGFARNLDVLVPAPLPNLAAIAFGVPLLATAVGWFSSGGEVADIDRQPMA